MASRPIQPVVFLQESSPRSNQQHPAAAYPDAPSFKEYMAKRQGVEAEVEGEADIPVAEQDDDYFQDVPDV